MILQDEIEIGLSGRNVGYYEQLGYKIPKKIDKRGRENYTKGTKITVKIKDLMPTSKVKVKCKCEGCGIERMLFYDTLMYRKNSQFLKTGETLCVICANKKLNSGSSNPNYKHGSNRYCEYRYNAQKRGLDFQLTIGQFKKITSQPCHYCGGFSKDYNEKSRGNGIDRKDSNIGYVVDNCVPSCYFCNFVKNNTPYNDFIKYLKQCYERVKYYEI